MSAAEDVSLTRQEVFAFIRGFLSGILHCSPEEITDETLWPENWKSERNIEVFRQGLTQGGKEWKHYQILSLRDLIMMSPETTVSEILDQIELTMRQLE